MKPYHKLDGETSISLFSSVLCGASGGIAVGYWKDVTCKKCLKKKKGSKKK